MDFLSIGAKYCQTSVPVISLSMGTGLYKLMNRYWERQHVDVAHELLRSYKEAEIIN